MMQKGLFVTSVLSLLLSHSSSETSGLCTVGSQQEVNGECLDASEQRNETFLEETEERTKVTNNECGVYLAPSSIPGAGLGMYAGKSFVTREKVTDGDIVVPLMEIDWHNGFDLAFFLWEEYTWSSTTFPYMDEEAIEGGLQGVSFGIGAAINCDLPLANVEDTYVDYDDGGLHRSRDPGSGAFTPFHNRKSTATRPIRAGEELYIDYGENYFESREQLYGKIPFTDDYKTADKLISKLFKIRDFSFDVTDDKKRTEMMDDLLKVIKGIDSRVTNAIPSSNAGLEDIRYIGSSQQNYKRSIKSLEWLEENGSCMDNIRPGVSTIAQAGRGAFATRFIPEGGLVAPAPLIHIGSKEELRMYDVLPADSDGNIMRDLSKPTTYQLLLNYCFGHRNSTLLLSPYGMITSLINHSSKKANTRIVWSKEMRHPEWREAYPGDFVMEHTSGVSIDFVALRDIEADEEILIDYGPEWERAWKDHVVNWNPPQGSENYLSAVRLHDDLDLDVRTMEEGGNGPAVEQYCHEEYRQMNGLEPILDDDVYHKCRVTKRYVKDGETLYNVDIFDTMENEEICQYKLNEVLFGIPRDAFYFEDEPYTRDHQMPFAFRHEMMIPDDVFPVAWMNKS